MLGRDASRPSNSNLWRRLASARRLGRRLRRRLARGRGLGGAVSRQGLALPPRQHRGRRRGGVGEAAQLLQLDALLLGEVHLHLCVGWFYSVTGDKEIVVRGVCKEQAGFRERGFLRSKMVCGG